MPFTFTPTRLSGVMLIEPQAFGDARGFFLESYKQSDFVAAGIEASFVQDNHSKSSAGVLRGLHYQLPPKAQAKLVRCTHGRILDVAVDIRQASPTFGQWVAEELSEENRRMLYIPEGFAHGFLVLSDSAELLYKTSNEFAPELDRGLLWNDPALGIEWQGLTAPPLVSEKDARQPLLAAISKSELF